MSCSFAEILPHLLTRWFRRSTHLPRTVQRRDQAVLSWAPARPTREIGRWNTRSACFGKNIHSKDFLYLNEQFYSGNTPMSKRVQRSESDRPKISSIAVNHRPVFLVSSVALKILSFEIAEFQKHKKPFKNTLLHKLMQTWTSCIWSISICLCIGESSHQCHRPMRIWRRSIASVKPKSASGIRTAG